MSLPASSNPVWANIISGKKNVDFEFLAAKMFLGSAQLKFKKDPASLTASATELFSLIDKNKHLPSVQKDILKLS